MKQVEGNEWDRFLRQEAVSRDVIGVKRVYIRMAGDIASGVVLSQILYWFLPDKNGDKKTTVNFEDEDWIAKKLTDWEEECALTPDQARRCLKVLEERGLIECRVKRFAGTPTTHIRPVREAILAAYQVGGTPNGLGENPKSDLAGNPSPSGGSTTSLNKEETTAETTAEINPSRPAAEDLVSQSEKKPPDDGEVVERAFAFYCRELRRDPAKYTLTAKRRDKALFRLRERTKAVGRDAAMQEIRQAILNLAASEYHVSQGYIDWEEQIFRSAEEFEKRLNWKAAKGGSRNVEHNATIRSNRDGIGQWLADTVGRTEAGAGGGVSAPLRPVLGASDG